MERTFRYGLMFSFCLLACQIIQAQGSYIHFNHLTIADGLSNSSVNAIYQDHYGFMWFATDEGLNRYDGKHFMVYNHIPEDSMSLASGYTNAVIEARDGKLWIATIVGVSCLDPVTRNIENYFLYKHHEKQALSFSQIGCLGSGDVLALVTSHDTSEPLLYRADIHTRQLYPVPLPHLREHLKGRLPFNIMLLRNGWVIYQDGIKLFLSTDGARQFHQINKVNPCPQGINLPTFMIIYADTLSCWFTNSGGTMLWYNYKQHNWKKFSIPRQIFLAGGNSYGDQCWWFGGYTTGLLKVNTLTGHFTRYTHDNQDPRSLADNTIYGSYVDRQGTLWLATQGGVDYWNKGADNIHYINDKMKGFKRFGGPSWGSMAEDATGRIWLGTVDYSSLHNALFCLDPGTMQYQRFFCNKGKDKFLPVWKILPLDPKHLLLSTQEGLFEFDMKKKICSQDFTIPIPEEIKKFSNGFTILMKDFQGNLWFGLWKKGLFKYDPQTRKMVHFYSGAKNPAHRLQNDWVFDAAEDNHHRLWVVCRNNERLICIDETSDSIRNEYLLHYPGKEPAEGLGYLWCDTTGYIWLCTSDRGLICFDPVSQQIKKTYTSSNGLISGIVYSFLPDNKKRLWLYTADGIQCVDIRSDTFYSIYTSVPPPPGSIEGTPMLMSHDGTIYIGYGKNLLYFKPDEVLQPINTLTPSLLSIQKPEGTIILAPDTRSIKIGRKDDFFRIFFASLDMLHSRQLQYSYRLVGYSKRWIRTGNDGGAAFTRLPPDQYELQMRAIVPGNPWNGKYASLKITVDPEFYQTRFFRMVLLILITVAFYYLIGYFARRKYRLRLVQLRRQQQIIGVRNRIAQDIHDDIGAGLTRITIQSELLKHQPASESSEYLRIIDNINRQSRELIRSLGEIVWTINPANDHLDNMLAYFHDYIYRFIEGSGLSCKINFPETEDKRNIHPDLKRNLLLILKESLNNIIKHAQAHNVSISFSIQDDAKYTFIIEDDGSGIEEQDALALSGNGLCNMRNRAASVHAQVFCYSRHGQGTKITIEGLLF